MRVVAKIGPRRIDERPDDATGSRADSGEAAGSGTADEPKQKRFRLVVERVPDRDHVSRQSIRSGLEEGVAQLTRHVFDRSTGLLRGTRHVCPANLNRQPERYREVSTKRLVVVGIHAPDLMMKMCDTSHDQVTGRLQFAQQIQQRNGIGSARERDEHTIASAQQAVLVDRAPDARRKGPRQCSMLNVQCRAMFKDRVDGHH